FYPENYTKRRRAASRASLDPTLYPREIRNCIDRWITIHIDPATGTVRLLHPSTSITSDDLHLYQPYTHYTSSSTHMTPSHPSLTSSAISTREICRLKWQHTTDGRGGLSCVRPAGTFGRRYTSWRRRLRKEGEVWTRRGEERRALFVICLFPSPF
ncbi:hypothetical protein BDZ89DRAFT_1071942, partial [Hymenopellis radicata]